MEGFWRFTVSLDPSYRAEKDGNASRIILEEVEVVHLARFHCAKFLKQTRKRDCQGTGEHLR